MAANATRVLLVDDSSLMRLLVNNILQQEKSLEVVGTAADGKEAVEQTLALKPDVVLLDLVMANYDGLYAVKRIMKECPTPILILSSLGNVDPAAVSEAIDEGAYDFLNKPAGLAGAKVREISDTIIAKVRQASLADVNALVASKYSKKENTNPHTFGKNLGFDILVIGASTGGTGAIEELLSRMPSNFPLPIVIAQHMPKEFVLSWTRRLDSIVPLKTKVARDGELLKPETVYFAPGNTNLNVVTKGGKLMARLTEQQYEQYNHPSVDGLFLSTAEYVSHRAIGVLLTGMGRDGAQGMKALRDKGSLTLAQDEATSVVYGMPKAAKELGGVAQTLPIHEISTYVVSCLS